MNKNLHIQLQDAEAKWNKSVEKLHKVQAVVTRHYNKVKKLREQVDKAMAKPILAKNEPRLTNKQWEFVLQGDGTQAQYKAQDHIIYNLLGAWRGGIWAQDENKQLCVTMTQNCDVDKFTKAVSILCKHYKPMVSLFDMNSDGKVKPNPENAPCFYFAIHDRELSASGPYYLEVTLDGKRARVLHQSYSRLSVHFDILPLKEQIKQIRNRLQ